MGKMLTKINSWCKKLLPEKVYKQFIWIIMYVLDKNFRENCEIRKKFGDRNIGKCFYVLRCDANSWGTYTMCNCGKFLQQFEYAVKKDYIPIVDLKNYRPRMLDNNEKDQNLWETMFEQPCSGISLDEVYRSDKVILGWKNDYAAYYGWKDNSWSEIDLMSKGTVHYWGERFNKYIKLKPILQQKVDVFCRENIENRKVLGVAMRECYRYAAMTDPKLGNRHPILKKPEESIKEAEQYMGEWGCPYIFLMSDDEECSQKFKEYFKDRCILYPRKRIKFFENGIPVKNLEVKNMPSGFIRNQEYLIEVEILARCDSIWSGRSSGTEAAIFRNDGKYNHVQIYNEGIYIFQ